MNNIYVDELPKYCYECPCYIGVNCRCKLKHENLDNDGYEVPTNCPLKPLTDRLAEERKKVVQEAKELVVKATCYDTEEEVRNHLYDMSASEVLELLDQIEKCDN